MFAPNLVNKKMWTKTNVVSVSDYVGWWKGPEELFAAEPMLSFLSHFFNSFRSREPSPNAICSDPALLMPFL